MALPLLVCIALLVVAMLVLATAFTGLAPSHGSSAPPWSGDQAPPGAAGLGPERGISRAGDTGP